MSHAEFPPINVPIGINEEMLSELSRERSELIKSHDEYSDGDTNDEEITENSVGHSVR